VNRLARSPLTAACAVAAAVIVAVVGLRSLGSLESLELSAYDAFVRLRSGAHPADVRILLVTISDADIEAQRTWPLPDATVAAAIEALARHGPRAIGLDIYRDVPVAPGTDRLEATLRRHPNVVVVTKFGGSDAEGVAPPRALRGTDQVGFNDVVVDRGGVVRRGLLFMDAGSAPAFSFAFRLATLYLAAEGIVPQPDPRDPNLLRLGPTTIRPLEPNDGAYVRADARGYQMLLDFEGGQLGFASVSLTDVLAGAVDPEAVRDRIVLIGVTAESVKDYFYTPHSGGLAAAPYLSGIALHGHIASQLVRLGIGRARPMRTIPDWQEFLWTGAWAAAGVAVGFLATSPLKFVLLVGVGVAGLGFADFGAFAAGWWLPLVPPAGAWVAGATVVATYVSYRQSAERRALMQLFSRHVSPAVAESIWQQREQFLDGGRPRPQRLTATVLFTDLVGFTATSEKLTPHELVDWLNEYMELMVQHVIDRGGIINKYVGDAIMALFGVPVPRQSEAEIAHDATAAVECALDMETTLRTLNERWAKSGRPPAAMRIGIFTGELVAGSIGSAQRLEYTVIGDTVNTASRLESLDKDFLAPDPRANPCRILIGESTLVYLGDQFATAWAGEITVKGKEHPLRVHHVRGRRGS
jgi:adenylate cyclase